MQTVVKTFFSSNKKVIRYESTVKICDRFYSTKNNEKPFNNPLIHRTPIQKFYNGKNIFITGGTGFMGKILIEKLLRSVPDTGKIFVLTRAKKGSDVHARVKNLLDDPLFDKCRLPNLNEKIIPISGDMSEPGLGISPEDRKMLISNVNVIFHSAATVKFNEPLQVIARINFEGSKQMIALSKEMQKLESFVHVSTAYSNSHLREIDEKFYDYDMSNQEFIKITSQPHSEDPKGNLPSCFRRWPNNYTVTKAFTENFIRHNCKDLPIGVFRPVIVTSTAFEPIPGWTDNYNGPTGIVTGFSSGLLRTIHCDTKVASEIVPVDMAINAMIACGKEIAEKRKLNESIPIYNFVSSAQNPITWGRFNKTLVEISRTYPPKNVMWYPSLISTKYSSVNDFLRIFAHTIPGLFMSVIGTVKGTNSNNLKAYDKMYQYLDLIAFFLTTKIKFTDGNVQKLWNNLSDEDKRLFNFQITSVNWDDYLKNYYKGIRTYLLKDDDSTIIEAEKRTKRFFWIQTSLASTFLLSVGYPIFEILMV